MSRKIRDVFTLDDIRNLKSVFLADAVKEFLPPGSSKLKADEKREALITIWAEQTRTRPNEPDDVIQAKGAPFETPETQTENRPIGFERTGDINEECAEDNCSEPRLQPPVNVCQNHSTRFSRTVSRGFCRVENRGGPGTPLTGPDRVNNYVRQNGSKRLTQKQMGRILKKDRKRAQWDSETGMGTGDLRFMWGPDFSGSLAYGPGREPIQVHAR